MALSKSIAAHSLLVEKKNRSPNDILCLSTLGTAR